jgi:spermidine/putrescine transport system ATP-binding protein
MASANPSQEPNSMENKTNDENTNVGEVQISGLRKEFGDIIAVNGIDFTVESGEFLTLLGPSGCGKSTTLRMISGLETPTNGAVKISGDDVTTQSANKRNTSLVFQEWALFPHMTVEENISFGLEMDGVEKEERKRRVNDALELVELPDYNDRQATELSGGQKQRVAMARAIVREPDVLLLDEPLASLDRKLRQHMQVELKEIQDELGITFIYVTHDQEEALTMSDRIAVLNDGQVEQLGPANELYEHPNSKFVATFLGETNIFEGTLKVDGNEAILQSENGIKVQLNVDGVQSQDGAAIAVRPERVQLAAPGELTTENVWEGEVVERIYKGSNQQYYVDIGGMELHVDRQLDEEERSFTEGDTVAVGFSDTTGEVITE